jgi:hypothetical protein
MLLQQKMNWNAPAGEVDRSIMSQYEFMYTLGSIPFQHMYDVASQCTVIVCPNCAKAQEMFNIAHLLITRRITSTVGGRWKFACSESKELNAAVAKVAEMVCILEKGCIQPAPQAKLFGGCVHANVQEARSETVWVVM